jgi:tRNA pseudouridine55 synthase
MKIQKRKNDLSAIMLIDKPAGWTSHDTIAVLRKVLKTKRIGHSGTLDPCATGLIIALIGKATKHQMEFQKMSKLYKGIITFGIETDTWDAQGRVTSTNPVCHTISEEKIKNMALSMQGKIEQIIPPYSAAKHMGTPMYKLARQGRKLPEKTKRVTIYGWSDLSWKRPDLYFTVECSSGTYVRSIAYELGRAAGCGAHLKSLKRLKISNFDLKDAMNAEKIKTSDRETILTHTLPI